MEAEALRRKLQEADLREKLAAADGHSDMAKIDPGIPENGPIDDALDYGGRALDYTRGLMRSGIGLATGQLTREDAINTLKGKAPLLNEYAKRLGIPAGPRVSDMGGFAEPDSAHPVWQPEKGGLLDLTTRGTVTGLLDMGVGPQTLKRLVTKAPAQAAVQTAREIRTAKQAAEQAAVDLPAASLKEKILSRLGKSAKSLGMGTAAGDTLDSGGTAWYKSNRPMIKADSALKYEGKLPVSPDLMDAGVWGSDDTIVAKAKKLQQESGKAIGALEDASAGAQGVIPTNYVTRRGMNAAKVAAMSDTESKAAAGAAAEAELQRLREKRPEGMNMKSAIEYKREQQALAESQGQYGVDPNTVAFSGPLRAENAAGATQAIENRMDLIDPGRGGKLHLENARYGRLAEAARPLNKEADLNALRVKLSPSVGDYAAGALGAGAGAEGGHSIEYTLAAIALKRLLQASYVKTGGGLLLRGMGRSGFADPVLNKYLLENYGNGGNQGQNPWSLRNKQGEQP